MTWIKNNNYANCNGTIAYVFKHPILKDVLVAVSDTGTQGVFVIKSEYFPKNLPLNIECKNIEEAKEIALKTILKLFFKEKEAVEIVISFICENLDKKLTKDEAIAALEKGKKIAHKSFTKYSYVYLDHKELMCDSNGEHIFSSVFWHSAKNPLYNDGWYIVE